MNLREAAQMALEALDSDNPDIQLRAATALRAALAQPEREWQGLTFDDWPLPQYEYSADFQIGAQWAEAKLKAKNDC